MSRNALNSRAFPDGSRKNIVHCSPGSPSKRTYGSITKSVPTCRESVGELLEALDREHEPEVRHRHLVTVHRVGAGDRGALPSDFVGDDLVALDVPVGPSGVGAATREPEDVAVELPRDVDVVHGDREVEGRSGAVVAHAHHGRQPCDAPTLVEMIPIVVLAPAFGRSVTP